MTLNSTTLVAFLFSLSSQAFTLTSDLKNGWRGPTLRININTSNCPVEIISAFNDAADIWNSVSTSFLEIKLGGASSTTPGVLHGGGATDVPVIVCDNNFQGTTGADQNSVAGVGFNTTSGGYITYGGVILNTSAGNASFNNMTTKQMAILLAHEMGHLLGIGHSVDGAALMYYNASAKKDLNLSQDDWDAMTYLYSRDEFDGDDLFACGSVKGPTLPPWIYGIFLMLPLALLLALRARLQLSFRRI